MPKDQFVIALIPGDGIGVDVTEATLEVLNAAQIQAGGFSLSYRTIQAGASYFLQQGTDIEEGGEELAGEADAILLGTLGLPTVRHPDGTEISTHWRLRERFQLYAGVRPVKTYPNTPSRLADPKAASIDLVILRESTAGLFYSAAANQRNTIVNDQEVQDIVSTSRATTERLHHFGFKLAGKRKSQGKMGKLTCVDKANVLRSTAFFRQIYNEIAPQYADVEKDYCHIDTQAFNLVRQPWNYDVLVVENMFGDILSNLAAGLVGGMGMAPCAEIGDTNGLFQPAHGSAPDLMGQNLANPLAAILSGAMMLEYLSEKHQNAKAQAAAQLIHTAVETGFAEQRLRPMEFGQDMGTTEITRELIQIITELAHPVS